MDYHELSAVAAIVCSFYGHAIYIIDTCRGKTRPHLFTWLVWSIVMGVAAAVAFVNGAFASAVVLGLSCLKSSVISVLALWRGEKRITSGDWAMFLAALSIIPIWALTKEPLIAALLATLIDVLGYGPTFRKAWLKPLEENLKSFSFGIIEAALSFLSVTPVMLVTILYPFAILGMNVALVLMLVLRRRVLSAGNVAQREKDDPAADSSVV